MPICRRCRAIIDRYLPKDRISYNSDYDNDNTSESVESAKSDSAALLSDVNFLHDIGGGSLSLGTWDCAEICERRHRKSTVVVASRAFGGRRKSAAATFFLSSRDGFVRRLHS
jgi:hypothetical protein